MQPIGGCSQPGKLHLSLASHTHHGGRQNECGLENSLGFVSARINLVVRCWASHYFLTLQVPRQHRAAHKNELECDHIPPFTNMIGMEQRVSKYLPRDMTHEIQRGYF